MDRPQHGPGDLRPQVLEEGGGRLGGRQHGQHPPRAGHELQDEGMSAQVPQDDLDGICFAKPFSKHGRKQRDGVKSYRSKVAQAAGCFCRIGHLVADIDRFWLSTIASNVLFERAMTDHRSETRPKKSLQNLTDFSSAVVRPIHHMCK